MYNLVILLCVITVVCATDNSRPLAFKTCRARSSTRGCKVKAVEVAGCSERQTRPALTYLTRDENDLEDQRVARDSCEVRQRALLNFTITVYPDFLTSKLSSQFTAVENPDPECSPDTVRRGQCPRRRPGADCSPTARSSGSCLFREYIRNGCLGTKCPLSRQGPQRVIDYLKVNPDSVFPAVHKRVYKVQWRLWDNANKKNNCCFTFWLKYN